MSKTEEDKDIETTYIKKPRVWYVEDIHGQTSLYIKAYKNKPKDIATVKVIEIIEEVDLLNE